MIGRARESRPRDSGARYEHDKRHDYDPSTDGPVDPRDRQNPFGRRRQATWYGRREYLSPWPTYLWILGLGLGFAITILQGHWSWARAGYTAVAILLVLFGGISLTYWRRLMGPLPTLEEALVTLGGAVAALALALFAPPVATLVFPAALLGAWLCWSIVLLRVPAPETAMQWISMCAWGEAVSRHPEDGVMARMFGGSPLWVVFDPRYSEADRAQRRAKRSRSTTRGEGAGTVVLADEITAASQSNDTA